MGSTTTGVWIRPSMRTILSGELREVSCHVRAQDSLEEACEARLVHERDGSGGETVDGPPLQALNIIDDLMGGPEAIRQEACPSYT